MPGTPAVAHRLCSSGMRDPHRRPLWPFVLPQLPVGQALYARVPTLRIGLYVFIIHGMIGFASIFTGNRRGRYLHRPAGEQCSPLQQPKSLPCVKGDSPQCGEMSRSDRGARRVSGWHGVSRDGGIGACMGVLGCTRKVAIPQSALPRSQPPLHKGAF